MEDAQILDARSPEFYTVVPDICGPSVWNLLHITLLMPRILRWFLDFWKICGALQKTVILTVTADETSPVQFHIPHA
jgi:hypothetical protein